MLATDELSLSVRPLFGDGPGGRALGSALAPSLDRVLGLNQIRGVYRDVISRCEGSFCQRALESLHVSADVTPADLHRIPSTGAVILASNHPLGGLDGLILLEIARRVRSDVRLLANRMLNAFPELAPDLLPVEVFAPGDPANMLALRQSIRFLRAGGCLATFPAGEVSRLRFRDGEVSDGPWSHSVAMLARSTGAAVVPVYFDSRNSWLFQTLGRVHPALRTCLLPRELLRKRGTRIALRVGSSVDSAKLSSLGSDEHAAAYLRARTYLLSDRAKGAQGATADASDDAAQLASRPVATAVPADELAREVAALPACRTLATLGTLRAIIAPAQEIPGVLNEIGRLREITFRAVGEGTGHARDLDRFDATYQHLFLWDESSNSIVGAYRLGLTDKLCANGRTDGLYTATLFRYDPSQMRLLVPGIELGRSFIRAECQRDYAPLLLLWRGIGRFVSDNPRYRRLFGTASISDTYPSLTRKLLVRFLTTTFGGGEFAELAEPTTPPKFARFRERETELACSTISDVAEADELVASIDPHGRGVPVLLRQYLRLGAKLIGFNVDPAFGNALDGLIVVDLTKAPSRLVARYMGQERYQEYLRYHSQV